MKSVPHFFHAEWGGDSHAGRYSEDPEKFLGNIMTGQGTAEVGNAYKHGGGAARASDDGDWSESYICNLFDWYLKEQEQMTNLTGTAQWIFKDFATPLRPNNPVPDVNQKGLLERDGTPKEGYYIFQSYWADQPMVHIFGHSWRVRWGKPDEEKMVKVFSNCREVELFVNGVSAGEREHGQAGDMTFAKPEAAPYNNQQRNAAHFPQTPVTTKKPAGQRGEEDEVIKRDGEKSGHGHIKIGGGPVRGPIASRADTLHEEPASVIEKNGDCWQ